MHSLPTLRYTDFRVRTFDEDSIFTAHKEISIHQDQKHRHHSTFFTQFSDSEEENWSGLSGIKDRQVGPSLEARVDVGSDLKSQNIGLVQTVDHFTSDLNRYSEDLENGFECVSREYPRFGESNQVLNSSYRAGNEDKRLDLWNLVPSYKNTICLEVESGKCSLGKRDFQKFENPEKCRNTEESQMSQKIRSFGEFLERNQKKMLASTESDSSPKKKKSDNSSMKFSRNLEKEIENEMCSCQHLKACLLLKKIIQIELKKFKQDNIFKQIEVEQKMNIEKSRSLMRIINSFNINETNLIITKAESNIIKKLEKLNANNGIYIESKDESINLESEPIEEETHKQVSEDAQIILQTGDNKERHEEADSRKHNDKASNQQNNQSQTEQSPSSMKQNENSQNSNSNQSTNGKTNKPRNLKRKAKDPKAPQISNKSSKKSIDFTKIEIVLISLFMGDQSWVNVYKTLNRFELQHIWMVVWKTYKVKSNRQDPSIRQLQQLQKKVQFKRKEEIYKRVYKPFIKHYLQIFKRRTINPRIELRQVLEDNNIHLDEEAYSHPRRAFFIEMFMELIERKIGLNIDLIMDICEELALPSKKKDNNKLPLTETENWRSQRASKVPAMKKISGGFRYLLSRTTSLKASFERYISKTATCGLLAEHHGQIRDKIDKKMSFWVEKYREMNYDDVRFLDSLKIEVDNARFKFPWSVVTMKAAIDCCLKNLKSPKILKEFEEVREMHYTFRG